MIGSGLQLPRRHTLLLLIVVRFMKIRDWQILEHLIVVHELAFVHVDLVFEAVVAIAVPRRNLENPIELFITLQALVLLKI